MAAIFLIVTKSMDNLTCSRERAQHQRVIKKGGTLKTSEIFSFLCRKPIALHISGPYHPTATPNYYTSAPLLVKATHDRLSAQVKPQKALQVKFDFVQSPIAASCPVYDHCSLSGDLSAHY